MKRLKMLLDMVKEWWKPEHGTVSMWDSIMARLRVKLLNGLIFILSPVVKVMSKIQSAAFATRSQAKAIIDRRTIEQIKPVVWDQQVPPGVGVIAQPVSAPAFIFKSASTQSAILTISQDGDVEWKGKPSEAAKILVNSFQMAVEDAKGVTKSAKRRYYALACRNILKRAEEMEYEEFLAFLNREVYNRERKVILDGLKD